MTDKMFFYAGVYDDVASAEADYRTIKDLHKKEEIGSYDSAIISKKADGSVRVTKTELPARHGAWWGLAAGAAVGMVCPVALPGIVAAGAGGAGIGSWVGHLAHGTNRKDAKEIGGMLEKNDAALVVVGKDEDAERIEQSVTGAKEHVLKEVAADWKKAEAEALDALAKEEAQVTAGASA